MAKIIHNYEHIICAISEEDLSYITRRFDIFKHAYFTFYFSELQITVLCKAWSLFIADYLDDPFLSSTFKNFPDFDNEIEVKTEARGNYYTFS